MKRLTFCLLFFLTNLSLTQTYNDPYWDTQNWLRDVKVHEAWDYTTGSPDVIVAVLGMGIDINHPDISQNIFHNYGWNFLEDNDDISPAGFDDNHEMAVAGIIASGMNNYEGIIGIAPQCKILPIKFWSNEPPYGYNYDYTDALSNSLLYIAQLQDQFPQKRFVINISYAFTFNELNLETIEYAFEQCIIKNIPIIVSAGNKVGYPVELLGSIQGTICVTGCSPNAENKFIKIGNYQRGPEIFISAPDYMSHTTSTSLGYIDFGSTSGAAAMVSGIVALLLSYDMTITIDKIKNIIMKYADKIDVENANYNIHPVTSELHSNIVGYGKINAKKCFDEGFAEINFANNVEGNTSNYGQIKVNGTWKPTNTTLPIVANYQVSVEAEDKIYNHNGFNNRFFNWNYTDNDIYKRQLQNNFIATHGLSAIEARYKKTRPLTVRNYLEGGNGGNILFGEKNFDVINRVSPYNENAFIYNPPSVQSLYRAEANQSHNLFNTTWNFLNWENGYTNRIREEQINQGSPSEWKAIYKGISRSDQADAYSTNSQRKVAQTSDGTLHMVYSSMGKIWYEKSTNNGVNWLAPVLIAENPYESEGAYCRNPAIAAYGNRVGIVYQKDAIPGLYDIIPTEICSREIINGILQPEEDIESYFSIPNIKPAVSYSNDNFVVAWKPNPSEGIKIKMKVRFTFNGPFSWQSTVSVPNTNANSSNPSLFHSGYYNAGSSVETHILTWQQFYYETMNGPDIRIRVYDNLHFINNYFFYGYNADISTGGGFATNQNPSVTVVGGYPMVSWTGINNSLPGMEKSDGTESLITKKVVVRGKTSSGWSSTFFTVGDNVEFSNIMGRDNPSLSDAIVSWSENNGQQAKFIKRSNGTFQCASLLSSNGIETQLSPSSTFSAMKAYVFNNSGNPPYAIVRTNNDFSTDVACSRELKKTGNEDDDFELSFGRSGIIVKNDLQFVFNIGDILLNDEPVLFIERNDTLPVNSVTELNSILKTEPFYLDGNSSLIFSNYFYVLNKEYADSLLGDDDIVSFRSELVKASTGQVVGTFNTVNYSKTNLVANGHRNYEINCSGIDGGMYYFRLASQTEGEVLYFVANVQSDASVLAKRHYANINYEGNTPPEDYALLQNYPNPFNPATIISYQIPADGFVTLKVYDILGKEVATLVNEQQKTGSYNVNFNASHLSSGVYIYELRATPTGGQAGEFIQSKKMMLLR